MGRLRVILATTTRILKNCRAFFATTPNSSLAVLRYSEMTLVILEFIKDSGPVNSWQIRKHLQTFEAQSPNRLLSYEHGQIGLYPLLLAIEAAGFVRAVMRCDVYWGEERFYYTNPSCGLLEIHELLRSNKGWKSVAPGEEEAHGRENYSDVLSV